MIWDIQKLTIHCLSTTEKDFYRLDKFNLDQIKVLRSDLEIINENEFLETLTMIYE